MREQEWAVARGDPDARAATLLFVRIRRSTQALLGQPCAATPHALCRGRPHHDAASWERPLQNMLHWCHYRYITGKEPKDKSNKREWEHFDRCRYPCIIHMFFTAIVPPGHHARFRPLSAHHRFCPKQTRLERTVSRGTNARGPPVSTPMPCEAGTSLPRASKNEPPMRGSLLH